MRDHPSTKEILKRIVKLERHLNGLKVVPATHRLRSLVVLPLLSKALTLGRAICVLIDAGFPAEAFATSRTLLEILFSVRYITNKFTEQRAEKYIKYEARVKMEWMKIAQKHCKVFVYACRAMNEAQPNAIQELYKMIRKFYRNNGKKVRSPAATKVPRVL